MERQDCVCVCVCVCVINQEFFKVFIRAALKFLLRNTRTQLEYDLPKHI